MEVLRALAREPVQPLEIFDREAVEVAADLDEPGLEELLEDLPAGALDVHPAPSHEVLELLRHPRRAGEVRAVMADGALVLDDRRVANRAAIGHGERALRARPLLAHR